MFSDAETGPKLFFEGYLKKRKDKIKIRWTTYWFRLHNTTLFFYNKKEGHASDLRGQYYIYTVQSVREVTDGKRHTFEMTMKNGKRKVLAAETAELRQEWVRQLWQAMHLSGSGRSLSVCTWPRVSEHKTRAHSSPCTTDLVQSRGQASFEPAVPERDLYLNSFSTTDANPTDTAIYCNVYPYSQLNLKTDSDQSHEQMQKPEENLYDVLPPARRSMPLLEDIYDTPKSCRRLMEQQQSHREATESIYDVPKSLLRKMSEHTLEGQAGGAQLEVPYSVTPLG
ncbi:hypothetical protein ACEWY4_003017 [Coilia grayii]|uniref:PH domain-containing protein n=1 Tax=Coilia grayii TaxID=363190 RepID=A0ABD1KQH5_9TELE